MLRRRLGWMLVVAVGVVLAVTGREWAACTPTATAFVVHPEGYLLTAAHVIKDAASVEVMLGGTRYAATILGIDGPHDVAVLHITAQHLPALPLGSSRAVEVGEDVRAFGFPLTSALGNSVKATRGTVSGIDTKQAQQVFQIDAAVYPGSSGGPLVNEQGAVIGVVTAKLAGPVVSHVGFVAPIDSAKSLLRAHGVVFVTAGAQAKVDGPSLVKRVAPAVGLVTVTWRAPTPPLSAAMPATPGLVRTFNGGYASVTAVAFSPAGHTVASGTTGGVVHVWETQTGQVLQTLTR